MPQHQTSIAALTAADALPYRELMLEAYEQAADAFTSTAEERAKEPLAWWVHRIAPPSGLGQSFGAYLEGRLVGAVALEYSAKPKTRHAAHVLGMYLQPVARRSGAAAGLMRAVIEAANARPEVQMLRLTVTEGNEPAIRLYRAMGFSAWGTEPNAILTPTGFKAKVHMSWMLRDGAAQPDPLPLA